MEYQKLTRTVVDFQSAHLKTLSILASFPSSEVISECCQTLLFDVIPASKKIYGLPNKQ